MGRALSLSLAGHLTLIFLLLLLSTTRQPLRIPEVIRPVRLVTYLDTPAPARARAPRPAATTPALPAPAPAPAPASRVAPAEPAASPERASAPEPPSPVAVPKFVIPTRPAPAPAGAAPPRTAPDAGASLRERLTRRLADAAPADPRAPEPAAPQIAALGPPEPSPAPEPVRGTSATSLPAPAGGAVLPIGNFPHAWYLTLLKEAVFARWAPPSGFYTGGRSPVALVSFRIDRAGRIDRLTLKEGSGYARFDQSAIAAVQSLGRAQALPDTYGEESLDVVIRFQNSK